MADIFDEILEKVHAFGIHHYGKYPNWLYINSDHFYKIKASIDFTRYVDIDLKSGNPSKIFDMQYIIKPEQKEIEVQ